MPRAPSGLSGSVLLARANVRVRVMAEADTSYTWPPELGETSRVTRIRAESAETASARTFGGSAPVASTGRFSWRPVSARTAVAGSTSTSRPRAGRVTKPLPPFGWKAMP